MTNPHGRGPGVVLDTVNGQARPGDRDDAFDHADREPFFLEEWSLLDVQLEIGPEGPGHARLGAQVADPLELVDQTDAVLVPGVVGVLEGDLAGHDAAGDHRRLKTRPLLVGEDRQGHGVPRPELLVVEGADHLETAEHAELAIVAAARRHGIHVRAHHHRWERGRARPLTEDVPHLIHGDREAGLPHPGYHPVAAALVLVREGQTGEPAAGGLPDPAELLDRLLQALLIDVHLRSPEVGAKAPDMRA